MRYEGDEFLRLLMAVEDQGGVLLPDKCEPIWFHLPQPTTGGMRDKAIDTTGCGNESRVALSYDSTTAVDVPPSAFKRMDGKKVTFRGSKHPGEDGETMKARGAGIVTACAVDDDIARWPRFAKSMQGGA
jgi:hypothetical protein